MRRLLSLLPLSVLLALAGCGGGSATVSLDGKLVPPAGVTFAPTDNINVQFIPTDIKNTKEVSKSGAAALFEGKDQGFSIAKIKPGKYKVSVKITPYAGMPESEKRTRDLEPINNGNDKDQTKLTYDVGTEAKQSITIDLAKGTVTKN